MTNAKSLLEHHLEEQTRSDISSHFWHRLRWRWLKRKLADFKPGSKLVDIGAGSGVFGQFVQADRRFEYFFAEPIESLRTRLRGIHGESRDLTSASHFNGVRAVFLLDVLEHIKDDVAFLKELHQKMDANTEILLLVPARQELWSTWDERLGHFRRYTTQALMEAFQKAGFEVLDSHYLFPDLYLVGWFRRGPAKDTDGGELPILPSWLNQFVYWVGAAVSVFLPRPPVGSSAFIHARKTCSP
jgi:hypothetical protein